MASFNLITDYSVSVYCMSLDPPHWPKDLTFTRRHSSYIQTTRIQINDPPSLPPPDSPPAPEIEREIRRQKAGGAGIAGRVIEMFSDQTCPVDKEIVSAWSTSEDICPLGTRV